MKIYIVVANDEVKVVTTNKEKAEYVQKDWQHTFNMNGDYKTAYLYEEELED